MKVISRKAAKAAGLKFYFTGKSCKHGHVAKRYASSAGCAACLVAVGAARYRADPGRHNALTAKWYSENKEKHKAVTAEWYLENKEERLQSIARWKRENPDRVCAHSAARRATKLQATPPWYEGTDAIACLYSLGNLMSALLHNGCDMHVDHRVGLTPEIDDAGGASGLHCYDNLLPIPQAENLKKSNHFDCESHAHMLGCYASKSLQPQF